MEKTAIQIRVEDQVATATSELLPEEKVLITGVHKPFTLSVRQRIPMGHKIALKDISKDEKIYKYGEIIGVATQDIEAGALVHVNNCWGIKARRKAVTSK